MAKEKKSPAPKPAPENAAKKSPASEVAAKKPVAPAAVASSQRSTPPVHKAQPAAAQLHDEIRYRAYELYRQRGGQHGSHEADWHRAESEVRSKYKA